jgi:hypothetical protein
MSRLDLVNSLADMGINRAALFNLNEAATLKVSDEVLGKLFEAIGSKYNDIDLSEIEKSNCAYTNFKYFKLIEANVTMLADIYSNAGESKMKTYVDDIGSVHAHMVNHVSKFSQCADLPFIQLTYNTIVATMIYSLTMLIQTTVRFVSSTDDVSYDVIVDSLPNGEKNVFFRNIKKINDSFNDKTIIKLLDESIKNKKQIIKEAYAFDVDPMNESFVITSAMGMMMARILAGAVLFSIVFKIIPIIREVIYSIYYLRLHIEEAIEIQNSLITANIESLDNRANASPKDKKRMMKISKRQSRIVDFLNKIKRKVSVKFDVADNLAAKNIKQEDSTLRVDTKTLSADFDKSGLLL